ncbi:MAG: T9SS type A sorting domain-containing protein [Bacteroidia bacterium]
MKTKRNTLLSALSIPAILLGGVIFTGAYLYHSSHSRQYTPGYVKPSEEKDAGAAGMFKYFFNARKNVATNSMDYGAMLKTEQQLRSTFASHRAMGALGLNWRSLGPSNVGGRTRAILIDNQDPTGQTIFAGGVSGGIWVSKNGGASWDSINDNLSNMCVSCIAQDANGNIYIGTGEGFSLYDGGEAFSTAMLGGGVFKSTDDGKTFNILPATIPVASSDSGNNTNATWAYTNRIAILPSNPSIMWVATSSGLMFSSNAGASFSYTTNNSGKKLAVNSLDVKISLDGKIVVACVGGNGYYLYPSSANDTAFTEMHQSGYGKIPSSNGSRIEFAISPTNSNYIYASVITNGTFDNPGAGIYMTMTAVSSGNGGNWYDIGPGGSLLFDPYSSGGTQDQATYDNAIGVFPTNPGKALFGGTTLWSWAQSSPTDTVGNWTSISPYFGTVGQPDYIHPDEHTIVFDLNNPKTVYIGCDGGIFKSTDGANTWTPENRNYDVTQFYAMACSPFVEPNGEGILGGTQDNGTPYVSGTQYYYQDDVDFTGGDGGQSAISGINPNAAYGMTDGDALIRTATLTGASIGGGLAYTNTKGLNRGANMDSIYQLGTGCFVGPVALYESTLDINTPDSMLWINTTDSSYAQNALVWPISNNGNIPFPYFLQKPVGPGDTVMVQNRVVSKIATAFAPSEYVWMTMQAIDFQDPTVWMPIGGPQSSPDKFTGSDPVHCMAFSPNGDALFVGTEAGQFYRFSNLDSVRDTSYITGGIISMPDDKAPVPNKLSKVISTSLTAALGVSGRDILSIAIDPKNGNNMLVTVGNYNNTKYVLYSNNALGASPKFTSIQGNLPAMPVYGSILDIINSPDSNGAVLATEHGIWSTSDVTATPVVWTSDNAGMANTLVCAIRQQTLPPWSCNNSGKIYIGTHGRGAWVDSSYYIPTGIKQITASGMKINMNVYPDPMNTRGTVAFTLPEGEDKVSVTIYDLQGRLINEIPVANPAPGMHTVNINSQYMPVGEYFATVTGTNFRQTTRFVVAR